MAAGNEASPGEDRVTAGRPARAARWTRWVAPVLTAAAIGVATLVPMEDPATRPPTLCIFCGDLGGIDFTLNVALFAPLGATLAFAGLSLRRASLVAAAISLLVEMLQLSIVSGRDAAIGDLLANTLGAAVGAWSYWSTRAWLRPTRTRAARLAVAATAAVVGILATTGVLLRPSIPEMDAFGQWSPQQQQFAPFTGTVHGFWLSGIPIPSHLVPHRERYLPVLRSGETLARVEMVTGEATPRIAAIGRLGNRLFELVLVGQLDRSLVFRTRLKAGELKLRIPSVLLLDAFPRAGVNAVAEGGLSRNGWYVRVRDDRGVRERRVDFSLALGWSFFMPVANPLGTDYRWWSALWMAALLTPVGYWAARAERRDAGTSGAGGLRWMGGTAAVVAFALAVIPLLLAFMPAHWSEWAGAAAGLGLGRIAARFLLEVGPTRRSVT